MLLKHVWVIWNYRSEILRACVKKQEIRVALVNIITNAIEAMPLQNRKLTLLTCLKSDTCILEIKDNNFGINEDYLNNINPYFT